MTATRRRKPARPVHVPDWMSLDNAAKIYPAAKSRRWTALFRLSATLDQPVVTKKLEEALANTLKRLPYFGYRLRRGLFWYYLDKQETVPAIQEDVRNPLVRLNLKQNNHFLFRVRVHGARIAVEYFHALTDGTGGLTFLLTLVGEYLRLTAGVRLEKTTHVLSCQDPPDPEEWEDSFPRYARPASRPRQEEIAHRQRGDRLPKDRLGLITGIIPTQTLYMVAKANRGTVNSFLAALILQCLGELQKTEDKKRRRPVKISLPINLRRYYKSRTLRNFSTYINCPVHFDYGDYSLQELTQLVSGFASLETLEPMVNARMSTNVNAERNKIIKAVPLFVKSWVLKFMYNLTGDRYFTTTLSNLGQLTLPEGMAEHVKRLDFIIGPARQNPVSIACLSYGGETIISFSRTIKQTGLETLFFRKLVDLGIPVTVESNQEKSS